MTGSPATISPQEAADRLAIRELIDAYADRRQAVEQTALFTEDAVVKVYEGEPGSHEPVQVLCGRAELAAGFAELKKYDVTMHFNGQSTIVLEGHRATGENYCLAHHIWADNGQRTLMVMGIRYYNTIVRQGGDWRFSERKLIIDWVDRKPLVA